MDGFSGNLKVLYSFVLFQRGGKNSLVMVRLDDISSSSFFLFKRGGEIVFGCRLQKVVKFAFFQGFSS